MTASQIFASIGFVAVAASAALQLIGLFSKGPWQSRVGAWLLFAGAAALMAELGLRSAEIGFFALTSTYESINFYAAFVALLAGAYRFQKRFAYAPGVAFGATMIAVTLMAIASSPLLPKEALPPIPALRSAWLLLHVSFSFIGEAFFVLSFASAILFLAAKDDERRLAMDKLTYTAIAVGYIFFTAGALIFGAIWAEQAWGRWWGWDPKETWALVTWLVYTGYLHLRLIMKRKDRLPAIVAVVGFLCTVFTFFGVNYLLPGVHSYG